MSKYKLLNGTHYEQSKDIADKKPHDPDRMVKHTKDNPIVECDRPLDEIFPNKFEKVTNTPDTTFKPTSSQRKARVNLLIASGDWAEEDRAFLEGIPDKHFEKVASVCDTPDHITMAQGAMVSEGGSEPKTTSSTFGQDVTDQFQQAYDNGFKVWKNAAGKYQVTKPAGKKPLNTKPLESGEVDKFCEAYLKG